MKVKAMSRNHNAQSGLIKTWLQSGDLGINQNSAVETAPNPIVALTPD
jgi:hypothetical protein